MSSIPFAQSKIVINEVMVNPGPDSLNTQYQTLADCNQPNAGSEWVEIYNTDPCLSVSLDCYIIGSATSGTNGGSFAFPTGTSIPPLGFIVVGGFFSLGADYVIPDDCGQGNLCTSGPWSLPNDYGWVALYNNTGAVVDAVFWTAQSGQVAQLGSNPAFNNNPCVPSSCSQSTLKKANAMTPGAEINYAGRAPMMGTTLYRTTDGTGGWQTNGSPSEASCNGPCAPLPNLQASIDDYTDASCELDNGSASVTVSGGATPYQLNWTDGENTTQVDSLAVGTYTVTVTDDNGCTTQASVSIVNNGNPVVASVEPAGSFIFEGEEVDLAVLTNAIVSLYSWTPSESLDCSNCETVTASPAESTTYTVTLTDEDGCTGTASAEVNVVSDESSLFVPTAFTPNEDGLNDILYVRSPKIKTMEFIVYDRWGRELFVSTDQAKGWDGTDARGVAVSTGVYVYYVKAVLQSGSERTLQGNVTLLR